MGIITLSLLIHFQFNKYTEITRSSAVSVIKSCDNKVKSYDRNSLINYNQVKKTIR